MKSLLFSFLLIAFCLSAASQPFYTISAGSQAVSANGMSSDGVFVVGNAGSHGFVWSVAGGTVERDQSRSGTQLRAVSPGGRIAGITAFTELQAYDPYDGSYKPLVTAGFTQAGSADWTLLPLYNPSLMPQYSMGSYPYAFSDDGTKLAGARRPGGAAQRYISCVWDLSDPANPVATNLLNDVGNGNGSGHSALTISGDGTLVGGWSVNPTSWGQYAALWAFDGNAYVLQTIPGNPGGTLYGLSNDGKYAAMEVPVGIIGKATLYKIEDGVLITCDAQERASSATAVSNNAVVVGHWGTGTNTTAFIYTEQLGMVALSDFLNDNGIAYPSGFVFRDITAISADGSKICGKGTLSGIEQGFYIVIPPITVAGKLPVTGLSVESPAYKSVKLSWTAPEGNSSLSGYNIYQGATLVQTVSVPATDCTLSNVGDGTWAYTVKAVYGTSESEASKEVRITMGRTDFPLYEQFNYPSRNNEPSAASFLAAYWDISCNGLAFSNSWYVSESGISPNSAGFLSPTTGAFSESVTSPYMDASSSTNLFLNFNVVIPQGRETPPEQAKLAVEIFADGAWHTVDDIPSTGPWDSFVPKTYNVSQYAGKNDIRVRFRTHGESSGDDLNWFVDNVELTGDAFEYTKPVRMEAHEDSEDGTIHINWTDPNNCLTLRYLQDDKTYFSIGNEGVPFVAANRYPAGDLAAFKDYKIYSLSFYRTSEDNVTVNPTFKWFVMQDGVRIYDAPIENTVIGWNTYVLPSPLAIDNSKDLYYGVEVVTHHVNDAPVGAGTYYIVENYAYVDLTTYDGRGNLFSEDGGQTWHKLSEYTEALGENGLYELFNLRAVLTPDATTAPKERIRAYRLMIDGENITAPIYGSNSNVSPNHFTDWTTSPDDLPCYSLYALYENQIYTDTIQYCMTGSGIAQIVNTDDRLVRLYPVPAGKDGKITVEINASAADLNSATIEICDVKGATVARHAAQGKQTEISVSGLPAGVYLLKVSSPVGLSHSLRFVVGR